MSSEGDLQRAKRLITLCDNISSYLADAQHSLASSRRWGIADILGGGLITNLIKHGRLDDVRRSLDAANPLLRQLGEELRRMDIPAGLELDIGSFASFADFFFDGLFADVYVQTKIGDLTRQLEATQSQIARARETLSCMYEYIAGEGN